MANLAGYIFITCMCAYMIAKPDQFWKKKVAKLEAENGGPLPQEQLDKKYKNTRIFGVLGIVFVVVLILI